MSKEFSYFGGQIGANSTTTILNPTTDSAGVLNHGSLLTTNSQYIRVARGEAPQVITPVTVYPASFNHARNTTQSTWDDTGVITVSGAPTGSTGRWLWVYRGVDGFKADFQMNDFDFKTAIGSDTDGILPNTVDLKSFFEHHTYNSSIHSFNNFNADSEVDSRYTTMINSGSSSDGTLFFDVGTTGDSRWRAQSATPGSTGTGISDSGNFFIYYEASGSFVGGKVGLLRTKSELTYASGVSPTCQFSYAVSSTASSDVGECQLYWVVEG